jgi:hypothetical protein
MATYLYLALTDGLTTITFAAGTSPTPGDYTINRKNWAPRVPPRRVDDIGGRGPYQEVVEEFEVNVTGASVSAVYANVHALARLLDNAQAFYDGDTASYVTLRYIPIGSAISVAAPYDALVLGRAPGDETGSQLALPAKYSDGGVTRFVLAIKMRIVLAMPWISSSIDSVSAGAAVAAGALFTVTYGSSAPILSPVLLSMPLPSASGTGYTIPNAMVITTDSASKITVHDSATAFSAAGVFTVVAATNALGGSIIRATPTAANTIYSLVATGTLPTLINTAGRYLIAASIAIGRPIPPPTAPEANWLVRLVFGTRSGDTISTPWQAFNVNGWPANAIDRASPLILGTIALPSANMVQTMTLEVQSDQANGSTYTLDLDYLVFVTDDDALRVVQAQNIIYSTASGIGSSSSAVDLTIDPRPMTALEPLVMYRNPLNSPAYNLPVRYRGDAYCVTRSTTLVGVLIAANTGTLTANYRLSNPATGALHTFTAATQRQRAYLVPE